MLYCTLQVSVSSMGSTWLDFEQRGLQEVVRASVSYYNSTDDIDALIRSLQRLVADSRADMGGVPENALHAAGSVVQEDCTSSMVAVNTPAKVHERRR
jgi:hypothetical protein